MERILQFSILFDFYKGLLTKRERGIFDAYHNEDLSLSEIADLENISKQAVSTNLKRAEKKLLEFENTLKLYKKSKSQMSFLEEIRDELEEICYDNRNGNLKDLIDKITRFLNDFEDV